MTTDNDRVRPLTAGMRWVFWVGSVLVAVAGVQLFVLSEHTDAYFAWTIRPPLTAAFLGAFYWTALVLAFLSGREPVWARARVGAVGVLLFVTLTLVATLLHLDRFHLSSANPATALAAWTWLAIYLVDSPALLVLLLLLQLRVPGGDPPRLAPLPQWFRVATAIQAGVVLFAGAALFLAPAVESLLWPWDLTPLTARAVAAWLLGLGVILLQGIREDDWGRIRAATLSYTTLGLLQLLALARYSATVDWRQPQSWIYLAFVVSILVVGTFGTLAVQRTRRQVALGSA